MKNIIFSVVLIFSMFCSYGQQTQDTDSPTNFNEIKLNGLYLVIGAFDITYERTINQESAYGLNVFLPFDDDIDINYYISPYYRFYFGKKYAAGFFLEGFGMLNSLVESRFNDSNGDFFLVEENVTDFALGIGLGGKWLTNSGFIGELNFGIGRNLFNASDTDEDIVAKIGISFGYRF